MPVPFDSGRYLFIVTSIFVSLTIPVTGGAAEWSAEPSVRLRREYNDNLQLSIFPQESVTGSIITPALDLGVGTPTWKLGFGAEATQRRYSGQEGLDRDDSLLRFSSLYRTERQTWQLSASRRSDSVVTSEEVDSDTGTVSAVEDRDTDSVSPSWIWMFSQTTQLQLAYQQTDVTYGENSQSVGLYDYRNQATAATLSKQISELSQIFISGSYSEFHVPDTSFDSKTRNLQAGITRSFSESTRGTLQAGLRRTESFTKGGTPTFTLFTDPNTGITYAIQTGVSPDTRTRQTGSVFSGNLETQFESTRLNMALSRSLNPSGSGGQSELDTFKIDLNRQLAARLRAYVTANAFKARTVEGNISSNDRTYYGIGPGADWQWSREWSVGMNYRYAHAKREFESEAAESHSVALTLTYRPLKMAISR